MKFKTKFLLKRRLFHKTFRLGHLLQLFAKLRTEQFGSNSSNIETPVHVFITQTFDKPESMVPKIKDELSQIQLV